MSDTPRTDAEEFYPHDSQNKVCYASFCRELERELNAALKRIDFVMDCNADVKRIAMERNEAIERIKRLEEAGDRIQRWCDDEQASENWTKAKEEKPAA